jgi:thymidylate synthase (FAD)
MSIEVDEEDMPSEVDEEDMSSEVTFSSDITVKLVRSCAMDDYVVQAAQVSARGENNPETAPARLIQALMNGKHGSPFEHNMFTFFVEAPIFVFREWQRHRISSFNEMSGRYTVLPAKFYTPDVDRPVINVGTKMKPVFEPNTQATMDIHNILNHGAEDAWEHYQWMLNSGIANEVARMVLPVNIYSQMYWTVNARSLMNFLSLRVESDDSLVRSYPQKEIQMGADQIEKHFAELMPYTYAAFIKNGRVAP